MTEPPSSARDQGSPEGGSLRLLAILHFAAACLCFAGVWLLFWQYGRMHSAFVELAARKRGNGGSPSLDEFLVVFKRYYLVFGAVVLACGIGDLLSGLFIAMRRLRLLSMFVACLNCLLVPLGTILGAFTMVVLLRDSVRLSYDSRTVGGAAPQAGRRDSRGRGSPQ